MKQKRVYVAPKITKIDAPYEKILFRFHCGSLDESMKIVVEIKDLGHLKKIIEQAQDVKVEAIEIKPYAYDDRIHWDSQIVIVTLNENNCFVTYPVGFLNQRFWLNQKGESSEVS